MNISPERQTELMNLAACAIESQDHWDYGNWDGYIADGELTEDEWKWLCDNCTVLVDVAKNEDVS